jgi:hypothetical protein
MRGATPRPLTTPPRRWCSGAALAAAVLVAAAAASGALAGTGAPTETTPTPTVTAPDASPPLPPTETTPTVTAPDAAPPLSAPKPDPGPVHLVPKPQPHVVHPAARVAPVVVHPVYRAPATPAVVVQPSLPAARPKAAKPRATPNHVAARRKDLAKPKQRPTPRPVTKPRPATAKPRPQGPTFHLQQGNTRRSSSGGGWVSIAIVAGLALLLLSAVLVATRRALRATPGEIASDVGLASANGSRSVRHEQELLPTRPVLRTTPGVEIASDVGLVSTNGSRPAPHDVEFLPLEAPRHLPTRSHPPILAAESCVVRWWRGYVRSQFLASETGEAGSTVIAESPPFPWRSSKPPPQTDEAVAAHRQLIATLSDRGWEAVEFGPAWFEVEFHRTPVASVST